MLKTQEIDIRALLAQIDEPLLEVPAANHEQDPVDSFDGVCTQHDGCRSIL